MSLDAIKAARPGDKAVILAPSGIGRNGVEYREARGRVVMKFATHLVLNMGGPHGKPGVATPENLVRIISSK